VAVLIVFFPVLINVLSAMRAMDGDLINSGPLVFGHALSGVSHGRVSDHIAARCFRVCASPARWL
jgi:hypothetical protein